MINLRLPILISSIFFLVFVSSSILFSTPTVAARVGHSLVEEEIPEYKEPEEPEMPLPEEPEVPEEPLEPEEPEVPEEPEEPPKEQEEPKFEYPSWIPSFPFPGFNGGFAKTEKKQPTPTVEEVAVKSSSVSEESSNDSVSNKKP